MVLRYRCRDRSLGMRLMHSRLLYPAWRRTRMNGRSERGGERYRSFHRCRVIRGSRLLRSVPVNTVGSGGIASVKSQEGSLTLTLRHDRDGRRSWSPIVLISTSSTKIAPRLLLKLARDRAAVPGKSSPPPVLPTMTIFSVGLDLQVDVFQD